MSFTKILIADDNPVFRTVLKSMLTNWGYETVEASNGAEACSLLAAEDGPRLAILDWMMPVMDGVDVCRSVRAGRRPDYIYILILTAKAQCDDLLLALDSGADDYVTKPFKSQELRVRLRTGLRILELEDQINHPAPAASLSDAVPSRAGAPQAAPVHIVPIAVMREEKAAATRAAAAGPLPGLGTTFPAYLDQSAL